MTNPNFYIQAQLCYGTNCTRSDIPWVSDFLQVPFNVNLCVLTRPRGAQEPGMYYRDTDGFWKPALSYENVCSYLPLGNVKIVLENQTAQTVAANATVFRSGFKMPDGTPIDTNPSAVWVVVTPFSGPPSNTMTLEDMQGNLIGTFVVV